MKMISRNILAGLSIITFLATACSLDLEPIDSIGDNAAFQTVDDLEKGMVGIMATYNGHGIVGMSDWAGDDLRYSLSNTGQGVQVHNWTYNSSTDDLARTWNSNGALVDRANRIIAVSHKFDQEDATVQRVQAECLFTRAYGHFEVVRLYCPNFASDAIGIPYKFESGVTNPSRLTQHEVYQYILADIDSAIPHLDQKTDRNYRITQSAAYALKARVAQYMSDWDMAIDAANKAQELGGFRLATVKVIDEETINEIEGVWNDEAAEDVEVIFRVRRENATLGEFYTRSTNGDIFFHPSYDLMNMYTDDDYRYSVYFNKDGDGKDVVAKHNGRVDGKTNVVDLKVFRLSEMLLIKAEAYVNKQMYTAAEAELNSLRASRIVSPLILDMSTPELALKAVQDERRRELAYEGHRFYDLRRWGLGVERNTDDAPGNTASSLSAGDYRFVFPIPQAEMFANENMVQNTGYSN